MSDPVVVVKPLQTALCHAGVCTIGHAALSCIPFQHEWFPVTTEEFGLDYVDEEDLDE